MHVDVNGDATEYVHGCHDCPLYHDDENGTWCKDPRVPKNIDSFGWIEEKFHEKCPLSRGRLTVVAVRSSMERDRGRE